MKRVLTIILCILLTLCSCEGAVPTESENIVGAYSDMANEDEKKKEQTITDITMLYYPDMDVNPVTTTCLANHELLKLVYSPLIRVSADFKPKTVLAEGFTQNGSTVTVTLKSGILFSDGTAVNANDVVKTLNAVKKAPSSPYYGALQKLKKFYASDASTVVFIFDETDVDCVNLLDIPIMKGGKTGIGCGPYVLGEENGKPALLPNDKYFEKASVKVIHLAETKNDGYIDDMFSSGALDVMISDTTDDLALTSLRDYQILSCPSNRFIFIGVNFHDPVLADINVRRAISVAIDRQSIASQSLVDLATPTEHPFNPEWSKAKNIALTERTEKMILGARKTLEGVPLTLTLPTGGFKKTVADELVASFKAAGITLNLRELDSEAYYAAVAAGDYQLYLGEIAVSRNMDPTALYKTGGALNFSGYSDYDLDQAFIKYKSGDMALTEYIAAFSERLPVIPVLYSKSVIYCAKGIKSFSDRSAFAVYGNGAGLTLKK